MLYYYYYYYYYSSYTVHISKWSILVFVKCQYQLLQHIKAKKWSVAQ